MSSSGLSLIDRSEIVALGHSVRRIVQRHCATPESCTIPGLHWIENDGLAEIRMEGLWSCRCSLGIHSEVAARVAAEAATAGDGVN